jgi:hypothetical protein
MFMFRVRDKGWRTLAIIIVVSVLAFAFFRIHRASASSTPLGDLAASLQPGMWAELITNNIAPTLAFTGGAGGMTFGFAENGVWDPVTSQFFYIGGDHSPTMPDTCPRFVSYTESTNTWQMLPKPGWFPCTPLTAMHGYDHTAIDPVHRKLYHRPYNDMVVRRLDMTTNTWTDLPTIPLTVMANRNCCVGVAWFPERQSLIYASVESFANGSVIEYQEATGQWQRLGSSVPNLPMGTHQQFAEYNPVNKVVLFGGGGGSHFIYKLDSAGQVTALQPAPISLGVQETVVTVDPVSGKYLVFDNAKEFWVYDVNQDTWDLQPGTPPIFNSPIYDPPVNGIVATPVDTYGVTMFVKCYTSNCHVYIYKHYPDNTAPSVTISSPVSGSTLSGTIIVSANAADDDLAGVQFKVDGTNIGAEVTTAPFSISFDTTTVLNGPHTFTAVARDSRGNRATSAGVPVTVSNSIPFNFSISVSGVPVVTQGQTTLLTVTATGLAGPIQPVSFTASGLPSGTTYSFSVSSCTPGCTTTLTLSTATSTPTGPYSIAITGTAGQVAQTASFTFTVSSVNASFTEKCNQAGNLNCFGFDNGSGLYYTWPTGTVCDSAFTGQTNYPFGSSRSGPGNTAAVVQNGLCVYPQIDTTNSHSGGGSLKFTIPSNSSANSSGFFTELFKRNADGTFPVIAPGSSSGNVLYFQFYQKFDSNFLSTDFQCLGGTCGGWKQAIWYGNPPNGASASSLEVTMNDGYQRGVPQMYGQQGNDDYGVENIIGCTYGKATSLGGSGSGFNSQPNFAAPLNPNCAHFVADQWMEFTGRIEVRGNPNDAASRVELWVNGQLVIDYGFARINWEGTDGNGLGQFQLTPYHTNKDPNQAHPTGYTWYDDVVISTQPIPMINGAIPTPDTTPPAMSNIGVSGITTSGATITWTTDKPSDSQVSYGTTSAYGLSTPLNATLVTAHSVSLSGLAASTTYHFTVISRDATGNVGLSQDVTFTTQAPITPPIISAVAASNITEVSATITWTTDKAANSQVEYGLSTSYGSQTSLDSPMVTSHSEIITGLLAGTVYNYHVKSGDTSGNLATSANFTFTTSAPAAPPTSGLIGYWAFNEGTGTATVDSSGNNNNGTLWPNISPVWTTGKVGNALQFNAIDNDNNGNDDPRVTIGRNFDVSSLPFTLSAWVNPLNFADWRAILSKRDSFQAATMRFDWELHKDTGTVYLDRYGVILNFTYSPPTNTWTHLAIVATSASTKLYVNGILTQQVFAAFSLGSGSTANTVIGGTGEGPGGNNDPFNGLIDEVRVYNRALSDSEIQDVYNFTGTDTTPPSITNIAASYVTNTTATIDWTTDRLADTQVDYGTASSYGQSTPLNSSLVTTHSVTVSGLSANTTYHFKVKSRDATSILGTSQDYTFTTSNQPAITLSPATLQSGNTGVAYNQTITASGGFSPYTFFVLSGSLPAGLALNSATGAITGTPTSSDTASFTIQIADFAGNTASQPYTVNISNVISNNVLLSFLNRTYDSALYVDTNGNTFVGRLTLNFTLTNVGPRISAPMYFRITDLGKLLPDLDRLHPNRVLSADNGSGTIGDTQQLLNLAALETNESTQVSFLIGIGSRQTFVLYVDLNTTPGSPATLVNSFIKGTPETSTGAGTLLGRFQFEVSETSLAQSAFPRPPGPATAASPGSPGNAANNVGVITGPGPQSRPAVAVDPIIPTRMAVAGNDYASGTVRIATTEDGGTTWNTASLSRTIGNQTFYEAQDPSVAFDSFGKLSVVYTVSNLNDSANAIVISESSDGINFTPPATITFHRSSERVIDSRPVVAIKSGAGRYVVWESLSTDTFRASINLVRSEEGGLFGPGQIITGGQVSAPSLAVSKSTVYVGWDEWGFNSISPYVTGGRLVITSSPGGPQSSFGAPQEIDRTSIGIGQGIPAMPDIGAGSRLSLAVDPTQDNIVYAVFVDRGNGMDVRCARSADSGMTWRAVTVNNDATPADQFSPAIAVDSTGNPNISFDDTRLSTTFEAVDAFLARPSGSSFDNRRISTVSSNDSRKNPLRDLTANLGDRTAIAISSDNVVMAWTDTRLGSEDIFLNVVPGNQSGGTGITWNNPAPIDYGTPLGTGQLNASASTAGTFVYNPPAGTILNAGVWTLSVTFTPSDTAHSTSASATVQIKVLPALLTVTATSTSRPYGSSNPSLSGSVTGVVNNDHITAAYTTTATMSSIVGDYAITPVVSDPDRQLSNYTLNLVKGTLHVQPSLLIVTADSKSRFYGSPNPPLTGSLAGRVNADNITATYTTNATISSMPGNYAIVPAILDPDHRISNYKLTLTNGVLTVIPAPIITLSSSSLPSDSRPDASIPSLSFGNQNLLSKSTLTLIVGNIGTASLELESVVLNGANARDFTKTSNCDNTLAVGKNCTIEVTFTPSALHGRTAAITITDNDGGYTGSQQVVSLSGNSVLRYAVYAMSTGCGGIELSGNALIDSFDFSGVGVTAAGASGSGDIAVNGNVTLSGNVIVKGAIYAPNTNVEACKNGRVIPGITVSGEAHATAGHATLTPVPFTTRLQPVTAGESNIKVKGDIAFPPLQPGRYGDIIVDGKATLTLLQGTYNIKSLKLTGDAKIRIASSTTASQEPVIINIAETGMDNPLDLSGGSVGDSSGNPANLFFFYGGDSEISLSGKADSYGVVYAPNASVKLGGQADWYGALVVKTLEGRGGSALHYDRNLGR